VLNELDAAPVDYREVGVTYANNDKRCPPRVSFHSERNLHDDSNLTLCACPVLKSDCSPNALGSAARAFRQWLEPLLGGPQLVSMMPKMVNWISE